MKLVLSLALSVFCSVSVAGILDSAGAIIGSGSSSQTDMPDAVEASGMGQVTELAAGLIPSLTKNLGVTTEQAEGGTGALLQLAKSSLSQGEFGKVSTSIPGLETLLAAAPALTGKSAGGLGGMMGNLGGVGASLTGLAKVSEQFEALGLSPDMISRFAQLIVSYFKGGEGNTAALLEKGLSAALGS